MRRSDGARCPKSDDAVERAQRVLEEGISTDFAQAMSYGAHLDRDTLLSAQLVEMWDVLATLTPSEYALIRPFLATSSGFQSHQDRAVEFLLGNKNADMARVFEHLPLEHDELARLLAQPTLYDEFLRHLARAGYAVPVAVLERDVTKPYGLDPDLVEVFAAVYTSPATLWGVYETCEGLVDVEDLFQRWRFRRLQVVSRTIGQLSAILGACHASSTPPRRSSTPSWTCRPCPRGAAT